MEQGEQPESRYVRLEEYVARPDHMFAWEYQYESATTYEFFYPVVSPDHPAAEIEAPLEQFALVVRPSRVKFDDDGQPLIEHGPLEGALAVGFDALEGPEKDFLRENYPRIDVNEVQVLVPGQKPWNSMGAWIWLAVGLVISLIGAASFTMRDDD